MTPSPGARAIAALDHPHICGIHDVGEANGTHYFVMPLLDGQTLAARLAKGPLPLAQALTGAAQVADALDKAHRQGIVHRDLKPANVMLTKAGAKLLDFGLAKLRANPGPISMSAMGPLTTASPGTGAGTILGTLHYMAPEQVEGKEADARSDLWALGAVLYEMLTGARPFPGETPASVIGAILKDEPPRLSIRQPLAPAALDQLIGGCLAKDPDERWQSAADVRRQLQGILDRKFDTAASSAAGPGSRRRLGLTLPVLAAGLIGAMGAWLLRPETTGVAATPEKPVVFTIEPPPGATLAGRVASTSVPQLAVSPDGGHVVFMVADHQGQERLWVRALDHPESRPLAGTEAAMDPFWSPDSRRVGFIAQGVLKVVEVGLDAGPAQPLGTATVDPRGATWSSTGSILFYTGSDTGLSVIPASGGDATAVPLGTPIGPARWPEFLPDGRQVLLQIRSPDPATRGIYLRSTEADAPPSRRLVGSDFAARYASGHLLFLEGATLMAQRFDVGRAILEGEPAPVLRGVGSSTNGYSAFSASATGILAYAEPPSTQSELRWMHRSGQPGDVVVPGGEYVDFRMSNDQSRVAYSRVDPQAEFPDVWIFDFARGTSTRITSERLTDASPVWSPNDEQLVFRSNRGMSNGNDLFLTIPAPGGAVREVYGGGTAGTIIPSFWLPDGGLVFYQIAPATLANGYGIWIVDVERGVSRAVLDTRANELQAALSPNGRWMAYASDLSGRYEIHVQDFPGGSTRKVVSTNGGMQPQWRGDGRELYYLQADGALMAVPVDTGERFDSSSPSVLFKTGLPTVLNPFRMDYLPAADGQRFLMRVPLEPTRRSGITVVLNWPALLKN